MPSKPLPPYASVRSSPSNAKLNEKVKFDASDSKDADGDTPIEYQWNFGNKSMVKTNIPHINHSFSTNASYPMQCTVVDKHNLKSNASLTQRVTDSSLPPVPSADPAYCVTVKDQYDQIATASVTQLLRY